jgi:hypothetical protein
MATASQGDWSQTQIALLHITPCLIPGLALVEFHRLKCSFDLAARSLLFPFYRALITDASFFKLEFLAF